MTPELRLALQALSDKKAEDILVLDLTVLDYPLCDYFVIATAQSDRQAQAIADDIVEKIKKHLGNPSFYRLEGYEVGHWILVDLGTVVLHILLPEIRSYYRLDELWGDARLVYSHV